MSRYTHQRSYRTMIDVVGPRRSGNRPRRRRWVKRLILLGVIYWVGTGLFGSDEDPVTGSAHCALGTYWGEKLKLRRMRAYQASERGGVVDVEWLGERMKLRGHAVTVWEGHWRLPAERP